MTWTYSLVIIHIIRSALLKLSSENPSHKKRAPSRSTRDKSSITLAIGRNAKFYYLLSL